MGDAVLTFLINSSELTDLLEQRTDDSFRDHRFGSPRQVIPTKFGLDSDDYHYGFLYYGDRGIPDATDEALLLIQAPHGEVPRLSASKQLIQTVIGNALGRNINFDGPAADLTFHGSYNGDEESYKTAAQLDPNFLNS